MTGCSTNSTPLAALVRSKCLPPEFLLEQANGVSDIEAIKEEKEENKTKKLVDALREDRENLGIAKLKHDELSAFVKEYCQ